MRKNNRIHTALTKAIIDNDLANVYALSLTTDIEALNNYNETPLFIAVIQDNLAAVRILFESGANPEPRHQCDMKWTPITWASAFFQTDILKLLIKHGADVNFPDYANIFAIDWANRVIENTGETEVFEILVKAGADLDNIRRPKMKQKR